MTTSTMSTARTLPAPAPPGPRTPIRPLPGWAVEASDDVDLVDLADRVVDADLGAAFDRLAASEEFVARLRASVEENLRNLRRVIPGRVRIADVDLVEPYALAGLQARMRIPQTALQRSYRVGFATMWEEWSARVTARARRDDVPLDEGLGALHTVTGLLLAYQHHVASRVADSFAREDEAMSRSREHVRHGLVRQLLRPDGGPVTASDLVLLDYPLEAEHVGVVLPDLAEGPARLLLPTLLTATHVRDELVHPVGLASTVVWLALPSSPGWRPAAVAALTARLADLGVRASVSGAHGGVEGLRATWSELQDVERVRAAWGAGASPRVLAHADVGLEVLLMADPQRARDFVRRELGGLGGADETSARLRETVEASDRCGSHITTAAHLHLHEHTVRNRLQKAAELRGRPLSDRRTELQVALRLARLLDAPGPEDALADAASDPVPRRR